MDLTNIYRTFCPTIAEYTLFSIVHGTFSKIHHVTQKTFNLSKFKKTEIIIYSDHSGKKLDINNKRMLSVLLLKSGLGERALLTYCDHAHEYPSCSFC